MLPLEILPGAKAPVLLLTRDGFEGPISNNNDV
jgi:hypothetical protein